MHGWCIFSNHQYHDNILSFCKDLIMHMTYSCHTRNNFMPVESSWSVLSIGTKIFFCAMFIGRIVEAISLGGQERALLVSVDDREVLLGVSQGRIAPLLTVSAGSSQVSSTADPALSTGSGSDFADLLASEQD